MSGPRVFWDALGLSNPYSGIFEHGRELARALATLDVHPCLVATEETAQKWPQLDAAILARRWFLRSVFEGKILWPIRVRAALEKHLKGQRERVILHGLSNLNLASWGSRGQKLVPVLTVHDMIPFLAPKSVSTSYGLQLRFAFPRALEVAERIICVSQWTRNTLVERFPRVSEKSVVIANGVAGFATPTAQNLEPGALGNSSAEGYSTNSGQRIRVLAVARGETYKRLELLAEILNRGRSLVDLHLVTDSKGSKIFTQALKFSGTDYKFQIYKQISARVLDELFAKADVLVHTSLYEGFCLPAARAAAQCIPVIYTRGHALDEILDQRLGLALAPEEGADHWLEAIEFQRNRRRNPEYAQIVRSWLQNAPTWLDAAMATKSLYTELIAHKN